MPSPRVSFQFTDEQWGAIRSVRKSWPDDIDWVLARGAMERLGRSSANAASSKVAPGFTRENQEQLENGPAINTRTPSCNERAASPLRGSSPDPNLEEQDRRLQGWLVRYEYFAGPEFRGRKDPNRHWLELGLLTLWIDLFKGDLSFSRKLDGTPHGPLVEFLTLTLHAITGSAPGPDGIAKIIEQYRKQSPYFPY